MFHDAKLEFFQRGYKFFYKLKFLDRISCFSIQMIDQNDVPRSLCTGLQVFYKISLDKNHNLEFHEHRFHILVHTFVLNVELSYFSILLEDIITELNLFILYANSIIIVL